ncbi:MAG: hypothetical protein ACXVFK_06820 [Solirubrobacteraceae bacterium]
MGKNDPFDHDGGGPVDRAADPAGRQHRGFRPRRWRAYDDPWVTVRREIDRSRRHAHQCALVRLLPSGGRHDRHALVTMFGEVSDALRGVDSAWIDHEGIFMLLPESDRRAAEGLLARLPGTVAAEARVSVACFPEDGLTANALRVAVRRDQAPPRALPADRTALLGSRARPPSEEAAG